MDFIDALPIAQPGPRDTATAAKPAAIAKGEAPKSEFAEKLDAVATEAPAKPEAESVDAEAAVAAQPAPATPQPKNAALTFLAALMQVDGETSAEGEAVVPQAPASLTPDAQAVQAAPVAQAAPAPAVANIQPQAAASEAIIPEAAAAAPVEGAEPALAEAPVSLETLLAALKEAGVAVADVTVAREAPQQAAAGVVQAAAPLIPKQAAPVLEAAAPKIDAAVAPEAETTLAAPAADATKTAKPASATPQAQPAAASQAASAQAATVDPNAPAPQPAADARAPQTMTTQHAATATPDKAPAVLREAPQVVTQVYTRFIERFDGRAQRFEISLDPAELGRVDVKIEVGADKKVHAVLAAHDSAALSDLMRGQRSLERALADAGVDLADNGLSFELSNNSGRSLAEGQGRGQSQPDSDLSHWRGFNMVEVAVEQPVETVQHRPWRATRLDLVA